MSDNTSEVAVVVVTTREELEAAQKQNAVLIHVEGELAMQLQNGKKIRNFGAITIGIIGAAIAATPFTAGATLPLAAAAAISTSTGISVAFVVATTFVGTALLMAIWKDYDEIEFETSINGTVKLKLKRRSTPSVPVTPATPATPATPKPSPAPAPSPVLPPTNPGNMKSSPSLDDFEIIDHPVERATTPTLQ